MTGQGEASLPLVSLVIPAYNEEAYLPAMLDSVQVAIAEWDTALGGVEVIVADNSSTDRTAEIARSRGVSVVDVPVRGIAIARNGGAAVGRGSVLCFCDADSRIHPGTFHAVAESMDRSGIDGGATGVVPEHWSTPLRLLAALTLPLRRLGIDSGVVFCRRQDFLDLGGYRGDLPVGEDLDFLLRLRRHLRARGSRLVRLSGVEAITSTRKFDKYGHWRFLAAMAMLVWFRFASPNRFRRDVRRYWYEDR